MKLLATLILGLSMICITATAQANVLTNPGFEAGNLDGWNLWNTTSSTVVTSPVHSGTYAVDATLDGAETVGCLQQNLWGVLSHGDAIYGNVWIKTDALAGQEAFLKVEFRGAGWENYGDVESTRISGTADWTQLSLSGMVPDATTAPNLDKINFMFRLEGAKTDGSVYFDNAYADSAPVPEPSTLMLLAGGLTGLFAVVRKRR